MNKNNITELVTINHIYLSIFFLFLTILITIIFNIYLIAYTLDKLYSFILYIDKFIR